MTDEFFDWETATDAEKADRAQYIADQLRAQAGGNGGVIRPSGAEPQRAPFDPQKAMRATDRELDEMIYGHTGIYRP